MFVQSRRSSHASVVDFDGLRVRCYSFMATLLPNDEVSSDLLRGYQVFIFSHDHPHPAHVHIRKGKRFSSWDLTTLQCVNAGGFSSPEIRTQRRILAENIDAIWRSWHAHWQRQERRR